MLSFSNKFLAISVFTFCYDVFICYLSRTASLLALPAGENYINKSLFMKQTISQLLNMREECDRAVLQCVATLCNLHVYIVMLLDIALPSY